MKLSNIYNNLFKKSSNGEFDIQKNSEQEKIEREKRNEQEIDKLRNTILTEIESLENLREGGLEKEFNQIFDWKIDAFYHIVFSSIISTLDSSFTLSFKQGMVPKEAFNDFNIFIEPWKKKLQDCDNIEGRNITREDYEEFKKDVKKIKISKLKQKINEVLDKAEEHFKISINFIDDYVKKIQEYRINEKVMEIKKRERRMQVVEEAEKRLYGEVKNKRKLFTEEEKNIVLKKFSNKCATCGTEEGLHIHHKDKNSNNNNIDNLVVLCGVCHKKMHMKVR